MKKSTFGMLHHWTGEEASGGGALDPLDMKVDDIDTSYPMIAAGLFTMTVSECKKETNEEGKDRLTIVLLTTTPTTNTKTGDTIAPGFKCSTNIYVTPTDKMTPTMVAQNVTRFCKAAGVRGVTVKDFLNNPSMAQGKNVEVKVTVGKETTNKATGQVYDPRNEFKFVEQS